VSKGVVVSPNPPVLSAEPWAQQDYMDAAMYYGGYPGAYYCGGEAAPFSLLCLFLVN
jgi:hypothetical protein